jgi:hypothetical protein
LDHRETAMGLCRLSRAVCESMGGRWRDGAGSLPTLGIGSHRCLHTSGSGRAAGQILDHRETAMGLCRLSRAVCESMGGRWRDGAGSLPTLGIGSHRWLHTSGRGRAVGQIFDHRETVMGAALAGAHSLRESWGAMARRRGQFADLGYCRSHRWLHTCWRGRSMGQIFDHRETVMGSALAGAHSLRESRGAMARRRRLLFDLNAVAYTQSTNTVSMRSPNANLIYLPSRVSQVSCEDGQVFVEGQLTTSAYAC